ncbi:AcrR family transcriptional regulator [Saccharothrix tamanrassetensis]|uniref:AcrR family transcriptional regulator n=1 Tax=Saccharothrix tamanrassetensis TaxID=1051531 RepID=A0A841CBS4_9PSEU|nr:TetR family transcriptional regulator [Saccharothrix tamanrassetensis]MBB5953804.1 AcrR family transcriptional regulator [Saccharothrix tamanrassetensis]
MVTDVDRTPRAEQVGATRRQILDTAERLFAEQGLYAVSNRQISTAAGQGNNAAVGYHFGTKADLVRAIVRRHSHHIEALRTELVDAAGSSADLRTWVGCLVRPVTTHLASLGDPTWFARFGAQVVTDPAFRGVMVEEALSTPSLRRVVEGLHRCLPDLPAEVRAERGDMVSTLMVHVCAERERALADGGTTPRASWEETATGLADAITGLLTAPVVGRP